jgi:hypothetical protein
MFTSCWLFLLAVTKHQLGSSTTEILPMYTQRVFINLNHFLMIYRKKSMFENTKIKPDFIQAY